MNDRMTDKVATSGLIKPPSTGSHSCLHSSWSKHEITF